eukprot:scaffold13.g313.t1
MVVSGVAPERMYEAALATPSQEAAGAEYYRERLAVARAVPPERRSACVRVFLAAGALLSEAADVVPPAPLAEARGSADEQLVARIKFAQADSGVLAGMPLPLSHPRTRSEEFYIAQAQGFMAPVLMDPAASESGPDGHHWGVAHTPHLEQLLRRGEPVVSDAHLLGRLLALAVAMYQDGGDDNCRIPFLCLGLVERSLRNRDAAAAVGRQLDAIRAGPAASSTAEGWRLPTAEGLQALALDLQTRIYVVATGSGAHARRPPFRNRVAWSVAAARDVAQRHPSDPNSLFVLCRCYMNMPAAQRPSFDDLFRPYRQGLALAREQGNLALYAIYGFELARYLCQHGKPGSLEEGAALIEQADASMAACTALLPAPWVEMMRFHRALARAQQQARRPVRQPARGAPASGDPICAGCGKWSLGLRARFCSSDPKP